MMPKPKPSNRVIILFPQFTELIMKLIATPDSLKIVDVPLKPTLKQHHMLEAAMQLATEVPVRVVGDTMIVESKLRNQGNVRYDNA
jgi:hypothetical protein